MSTDDLKLSHDELTSGVKRMICSTVLFVVFEDTLTKKDGRPPVLCKCLS
jgi:hypothetical protein